MTQKVPFRDLRLQDCVQNKYREITEQMDVVFDANPESSCLEKDFEELQADALDQNEW